MFAQTISTGHKNHEMKNRKKKTIELKLSRTNGILAQIHYSNTVVDQQIQIK